MGNKIYEIIVLKNVWRQNKNGDCFSLLKHDSTISATSQLLSVKFGSFITHEDLALLRAGKSTFHLSDYTTGMKNPSTFPFHNLVRFFLLI